VDSTNKLRDWLRAAHLPARMIVYGLSFLGLVIVVLPYCAYQIDRLYPQWHYELGGLRILGVVLFVGAAGMYCWSAYLLAHKGRGAYVEFDPPAKLVLAGPFRWMRNPIAACVVAMLLGEAVALSSTGIFALFLIAVPLAHLQAVLIEEPLLTKRFGEAYLQYRSRVPRWLPKRPKQD
jgi:protein-S-isoprenylcysteine O-methyltransferase Ste14